MIGGGKRIREWRGIREWRESVNGRPFGPADGGEQKLRRVLVTDRVRAERV
jgi:hypothetical protein